MMQMNRKTTKSRKTRKTSLFDHGLISQQKLFEEIIDAEWLSCSAFFLELCKFAPVTQLDRVTVF